MIRRHRHSGIVIDTNLLILYLLGSWNRPLALGFKRTRAYDDDDLDVLQLLLSQFDRLVVAAAILAEVSNLSGTLKGGTKEAFFSYLAELLPSALFEEKFVELRRVCCDTCFVKLGFTDATISEIGAEGVPVLTDDLPLYVHLIGRGVEAFNFTHLRGLLI
jgi:hypothetical protein